MLRKLAIRLRSSYWERRATMLVIVLSKRVNVAALLLNRRIAAQANREMCRIPASAETRLTVFPTQCTVLLNARSQYNLL